MAIVVLDPGHGGTTTVGGSSPNNATGPTGLKEKTVTLDIARRVDTLLTADGIDVRMTRTTDRNVGLADRAHVARDARADAFVAIHFNGFDRLAQGTETYHHTSANADSRALAALVQAEVVKATGLKDRKVKKQNFEVLRPINHHSGTAVCLVEISFMDVPAEEARLKTATYKESVAVAIARAVKGWLVADQRL